MSNNSHSLLISSRSGRSSSEMSSLSDDSDRPIWYHSRHLTSPTHCFSSRNRIDFLESRDDSTCYEPNDSMKLAKKVNKQPLQRSVTSQNNLLQKSNSPCYNYPVLGGSHVGLPPDRKSNCSTEKYDLNTHLDRIEKGHGLKCDEKEWSAQTNGFSRKNRMTLDMTRVGKSNRDCKCNTHPVLGGSRVFKPCDGESRHSTDNDNLNTHTEEGKELNRFKYDRMELASKTHGFSRRNRMNDLKCSEHNDFDGHTCPINWEQKSWEHIFQTSWVHFKNHPEIRGPRVVTPSDGKTRYNPESDDTEAVYQQFENMDPFHPRNLSFVAQTHGFSRRNRMNAVKRCWQKDILDDRFPVQNEGMSNERQSASNVTSKNNRIRMSRLAYPNHPPLGGPRVVTPSDGKSKYVPKNDEWTDFSGLIEERHSNFMRSILKAGKRSSNRSANPCSSWEK